TRSAKLLRRLVMWVRGTREAKSSSASPWERHHDRNQTDDQWPWAYNLTDRGGEPHRPNLAETPRENRRRPLLARRYLRGLCPGLRLPEDLCRRRCSCHRGKPRRELRARTAGRGRRLLRQHHLGPARVDPLRAAQACE